MPDGTNQTATLAEPAAAATVPPPRRRRRLLRLVLLAGVPLLVAVVGLYVYAVGGRYVGTDNAYVHADKVLVAPEISGRITAVEVTNNEPVEAGRVLFRIDDAAARYALEQAEAELRQVEYDFAEIKANLKEQQNVLARARTTAEYAQRTLDRIAPLARNGNASQSALDDAHQAVDTANSNVAVARSRAGVLLAKLGGDPNLPLENYPPYRQAQARRDQAQLDLDHTVVRAPFDGIATEVDRVQPGAYVTAGASTLAVVRSDRVWIEANMNETDLTHVTPGQPVTVSVDTYPAETWTGTVDSLSPASGAEFALLPAQNSSGNWVKVTQRIPVRIEIDTRGMPQLRAGMSTEVEIDTGHSRGLPFLGGTAFGAER